MANGPRNLVIKASERLNLPADVTAGVSRVELLPFHRMGSGKYDALGIPYAYRSVDPPSAAHLNVLLDACRAAGANASLGG